LKTLFKKTVLAGFALSIGLAFAELLLRLLGINYAAVPMIPDPILHHVHQKNIRFLNYNRKNEFPSHSMYFDSEGRVNNPDVPMYWNSNASTRVILMGDSFMEAAQVSFENTTFGRLVAGKPPDSCIINAGVGSYSPVLYRLQWKKDLAALQPSHVVLLLYVNDLGNDSDYTAIAGEGPDALPEAVPGPKQKWYTPVWHGSYFCRLLRRIQQQYMHNNDRRIFSAVHGDYAKESPVLNPTTLASILDLKTAVENSGSKFILTAVPSKQRHFNPQGPWNEPEFADKMMHWAGENRIEFIDLAERFRRAGQVAPLFFTTDIHYTAAGHALTAEGIAERLPGWPASLK